MFGKLWSELQDLFGDLRGPAKALIVVLIGMAFAWMLINHQWAAALKLVLAAIVAGYLLELIGNLFLPKMPRAGLFFLEGWVLGPAAIAAFVSGLIVVVAIDLSLIHIWTSGGSSETDVKEFAVSALGVPRASHAATTVTPVMNEPSMSRNARRSQFRASTQAFCRMFLPRLVALSTKSCTDVPILLCCTSVQIDVSTGFETNR